MKIIVVPEYTILQTMERRMLDRFQKQVVLKEETKNSLSYLHVSVIESRRLMKGIASTHLAPAFELGGSLPLKERSSR